MRLSICIATYNRAKFLDDSLYQILLNNYNKENFEIVIVDGGSNDNTEDIVQKYKNLNLDINFIKLQEKGGIDKDFDISVKNSKYEYCWLLPDDDLINPNALEFIFNKIVNNFYPDLLILNSNCWNYDLTDALNLKNIDINKDIYISNKNFQDELFKITHQYLSYIGAIVIKKDIWIKSNTTLYYGSRFIHLGVISEMSLDSTILITSDPVIKIRLGNAEWSNVSFKIWYHLWPSVMNNYKFLNSKFLHKLTFRQFKSKLGLFLYHRSLGTFNFRIYIDNILKSENITTIIIGFLVLLIPPSFLRKIYFLRYYFTKNKVGMFNIRDGRVSKNSWKSDF